MKSGTLVGYKVISKSEGKDLGSVRQVIFDAPNKRTAALLLGDKDLFGLMDAHVVLWDQILEIGENAVIVQNAESCQKGGNLPQMIPLLETKNLVPGAKLYTEDGTGLGHIKDVIFEADGAIIDYELSEGLVEDTFHGTRFLPATYNLRMGEDVIFVDPAGAKDLRASPPDLQSSAEAVRKQMGESFSQESISKSTNQLQKSIDTAATQLKNSWKGKGDPPVPPENEVQK